MIPQIFTVPQHIVTASKSLWCCYSHSVDGIPIFIGVCRFQEVLQSPDAQRNTAWVKNYGAQPITINVLHISVSYSEVYTFRNQITRTTLVYCNRHGREARHFTAIRCIETGQVWKNAADVCREFGFNKGNFSMHLNRRPRYKTMNGKTYERYITVRQNR